MIDHMKCFAITLLVLVLGIWFFDTHYWTLTVNGTPVPFYSAYLKCLGLAYQ